MKLYNTLTKKKEEFTPIEDGKVKMYHCGPTVYDLIHIGNLRAFLLGDIIRRSFEYLGFSVLQVMNITDVGHLVSDGDDGDDKMTKGLKREGKEINLKNMLALANNYAEAFKEDIEALNILKPHHLPKASDHIAEDIEIIKQLETKGFVYTTSNGVYFDTSKMEDYGKLGGLNLDKEGQARITGNSEKKNYRDFALWKFDDQHGWDSPWGHGFPGWHIECSGMSKKYLGETFDIHTGGADLASVHHNNEIAQSESASGKDFVHYWLHNAFITVPEGKMSKSSGTGLNLRILVEKGYDPLSYRYWLLQGHYRSPMEFSFDALNAAKNGLEKFYSHIANLENHTGHVNQEYKEKFIEKIEDDFNTPQALALVHELLKDDTVSESDKRATILDFDRVLGLNIAQAITNLSKEVTIPDGVAELLDQRKKARADKNWELSDQLRDQINKLGFEVKDAGDEQVVSKFR